MTQLTQRGSLHLLFFFLLYFAFLRMLLDHHKNARNSLTARSVNFFKKFVKKMGKYFLIFSAASQMSPRRFCTLRATCNKRAKRSATPEEDFSPDEPLSSADRPSDVHPKWSNQPLASRQIISTFVCKYWAN